MPPSCLSLQRVAAFTGKYKGLSILTLEQHRSATISGSTATALAMGGMVPIGNAGGIVASFLFPGDTAPMYAMGNWTIFGCLVVCIVITLYGWRTYGSHAGYRTGRRDSGGNIEVLDAADGDPVEMMNEAMGLGPVKPKVDDAKA